jgi:hypothetical protein
MKELQESNLGHDEQVTGRQAGGEGALPSLGSCAVCSHEAMSLQLPQAPSLFTAQQLPAPSLTLGCVVAHRVVCGAVGASLGSLGLEQVGGLQAAGSCVVALAHRPVEVAGLVVGALGQALVVTSGGTASLAALLAFRQGTEPGTQEEVEHTY